jgi:peptidoglycan/LPS O-acetylase OafA/YrhL
MKIQRTIGSLWLALFSFGICLWIWQFAMKINQGDFGTHAFLTPFFLFGVVASIFLIRGARWAHIAIVIMASLIGVLITWNILQTGWRWSDKWADDSLCVFSLASVVLLLIPRHEPVA